MTRVFVLAEIRLYRDGLARVLDRTAQIDIVGTAGRWAETASAVASLRPDIVLVDMATPGSFKATHAILALSPAPKIVALAVPEGEQELLACAEAGISGYVTREDSIETLVAAIESVARGELLTTPRIAAVLLQRVGALAAAVGPPGRSRLTPRELEIVELIEQGLSNKVIAQQLSIELSTVKHHVHNILEKLQVHRRADVPARVRLNRTTSFAPERSSP